MCDFTMLPCELLHKMLLPMEYDDIISFSITNKINNIVCRDNVFWMTKLDYEFEHEEQTMKPSYYVLNYRHPDTGWINIYKRWKNSNIKSKTQIKNMHNDIIFWTFDIYRTYITNKQYM